MHSEPRDQLHVSPQMQPIFRELGIDAEAVFDHPRIAAWRTLDDRANCTLDAALADGRRVRWHIKRYAPARGSRNPAQEEVDGHRLLMQHEIPTAELIAWGRLADERSFVIFDDLTDYGPADKLVADGMPFDEILEPTAALAAKLHAAGLHHRDLYLCHFFVGERDRSLPVRLIDPARVRALPRLFARRWIVKDLAQFWYSTEVLPISDAQRERWLGAYSAATGSDPRDWRAAVVRKVASIRRHDVRLRRLRPHRSVSIPT